MRKIILIAALILVSNASWTQNNTEITSFDKILDQYLNVRDFCLSSDGKEAFVTIQSLNGEISQIVTIKKENEHWQAPELLPFCDAFLYLEPFLSADENRLFFVSNRPLDSQSLLKKDFDIWYVDRKSSSDTWSEPKNMGAPINSTLDEFYPTVSDNNNLYFTMDAPSGMGKDDIYFSKWEKGTYLKPILLDENINSSGYEFNAFVSKKEDFLLFTKYNTPDGQGSGDLYISKKDADGKWQKATNLGLPINTKFMEYCPFYDEKNQMLYFTSKRQNKEPRAFQSISDLKNYLQEGENGLSKIYKTAIKLN